jgi:hypothetical protein
VLSIYAPTLVGIVTRTPAREEMKKMNSGRRLPLLGPRLANLFALIFFGTHFLLAANTPSKSDEKLVLRDHWALQTSAKVEAKGEIISTPSFLPKGWHDATVPTTVVAALVHDKTLPDPFFAMNLRQFPGVTYPIGGTGQPLRGLLVVSQAVLRPGIVLR